MKLTTFILALICVSRSTALGDDYPRDPNIDVLHYSFGIVLSDRSDEISGEARISVKIVGKAVSEFSVDLVGGAPKVDGMRVFRVSIGEKDLDFEHAGDRLRILLGETRHPGEIVTLHVLYRGVPRDGLIISETKYGNRSFFGDNWPDRARHWLPTVDHPSDKATCEFVVTAPNIYQVVANGALVEETDLEAGRRRTHWKTHVPVPTKVMVFGAARFAVRYLRNASGISVESWVYPRDAEIGFHDFGMAPGILDFFEGHVGPFPYAKLANVQSKTRYGGMENAGAIFYSEKAIRGDRSNEGLMAHEIAHQWFGDSVTEDDWNHVWLSEGFATYMSQLYLESRYGSERLRTGMKRSRSRVIEFAKSNPQLAVVQEAGEKLMQLLNANSYQKGGWFLHMLRSEIGDENFWTLIRAYYAEYRDGNARTADFRALAERISGETLERFFKQWLHRPGVPKIAAEWTYSTKGELTIDIAQTLGSGDPFSLPLEIDVLDMEGAKTRLNLEMTEKGTTLRFPVETEPTQVTLDPEVWLLADMSVRRKVR